MPFANHTAEIARLVRTVDSNPNQWPVETRARLEEHWGFARFFCDPAVMKPLDGRADRIHKVLRDTGFMGGHAKEKQFKADRLRDVVKGRAVTLKTIVNISEGLQHIANHANAAVRQTTVHGAPGQCFVMPDNCVVPSLYAVNRAALEQFRLSLGLNRSRAAEIVYNSGNVYEIFADLESGFHANRNLLGYRVTKPFVRHFMQVMQAYCAARGLTCPAERALFSDHPEGGDGLHTQPLGLLEGNMLS